MKVMRSLPPAASPMGIRSILSGLRGIWGGNQAVERFRSELKRYYGMDNCYLLSSGKAALYVILKALHEIFPERRQVVIPAFTCYSVPSAIARAGFEIRLCDIDRETLDFDFDHLAEICGGEGEKILAVVPMHLYGVPPDIVRLRRIVRDAAITVVEDAAQAMGGTWRGRLNGVSGDVGFFSLSRGKALSTMEGGIVLTRRRDIAAALERQVAGLPEYPLKDRALMVVNSLLMSLFMHPALFWLPRQLPFLKVGETVFDPDFPIRKLSAVQGGFARDWQERLARFNAIRSQNTCFWWRFFQELARGPDPGQAFRFIGRRRFARGGIRFPLKIEPGLREAILRESERVGAGVMPSYPDSVDGISGMGFLGRDKGFPVAKEMAKRLVTLPVHGYVSERDRLKICRLFQRSLEGRR